ncbi:Gfo/Idh/MocA family protein [Flagellimonas algicola]|uniref:Gfo/Idh/MocA family oxidoreductase n=1 Tax=Flagellimonas algicola TaxID=2583815 RepID=A0ABY2WGM4_9FLAO|nr:Gfo/Idh/MocA family oxidoreductase [Allomuricauda algicola]TMU50710.1 Gfo/Idh/MocA family oxidoreductase [Allomuricauda algicola]
MKTEQKNGRRTFIKKSASAALGGTMLALVPHDLYPNSTKSLKIGLVGCGRRGTGALFEALNVTSSVKVVALGDTFKDNVDRLHQRLKANYDSQCEINNSGKFVGFDAYKKVIELSDVVLLATPPPFRPLHFEAAVTAGKHTFLEKPLAVDVPGYRKVMETGLLADQKKLVVSVGLQFRYSDAVQEMVKRVQNGEIGEITSMNTYYNVGEPKIVPREAHQTEMEYQLRNWRYFTWLWGGQPAGQAIHQIDIMNMVMDNFPSKALGNGGRLVFSGTEQGNTYDHFFIQYQYPNGIQLHSQCRNMNHCANRMGWEIRGTKGIANERFQFKDYQGKTFWKYRDNTDIGNSQKVQTKFIQAILNGTRFNDTTYGAESTLTTIMGRLAAETGQVMTLDNLIKSSETIVPADLSWNSKSLEEPMATGVYKIVKPGKKR